VECTFSVDYHKIWNAASECIRNSFIQKCSRVWLKCTFLLSLINNQNCVLQGYILYVLPRILFFAPGDVTSTATIL